MQQSASNAAMMIEFQPGTKVVCGSYIILNHHKDGIYE